MDHIASTCTATNPTQQKCAKRGLYLGSLLTALSPFSISYLRNLTAKQVLERGKDGTSPGDDQVSLQAL